MRGANAWNGDGDMKLSVCAAWSLERLRCDEVDLQKHESEG